MKVVNIRKDRWRCKIHIMRSYTEHSSLIQHLRGARRCGTELDLDSACLRGLWNCVTLYMKPPTTFSDQAKIGFYPTKPSLSQPPVFLPPSLPLTHLHPSIHWLTHPLSLYSHTTYTLCIHTCIFSFSPTLLHIFILTLPFIYTDTHTHWFSL